MTELVTKKTFLRKLPALSSPSLSHSLEGYIAWVNGIPLLTEEEEQNLASNYVNDSCVESARRLVLSHLRFVVRVAHQYLGYGLSVSDLIQEGNIGLMKAVQRFNPSRGVRLVTFAVHWVKSEIHEFVMKNWRIVKVATTKAHRKLFFKLRSLSGSRQSLTEQDAKNIADFLDVKVSDVKQMEMRMQNTDNVFDPVLDGQEVDEDSGVVFHSIADDRFAPHRCYEKDDASETQKKALMHAFKSLDDRSQYVLNSRLLCEKEQKLTLKQIAETLNISTERARQLESQALKQMKKILSNTEL